MAKVVVAETTTVIDRTWSIWLRTLAIGAGLGLVFWIMTILLSNYVIEPLACRELTAAGNCSNAVVLGGNIATILTALVGIAVMVRLNVFRPIILAVATAALLWNLAGMTNGLFWAEALLWSIVLYAATYGLFAWISRYPTLWVSLVISILIVVIIRIALVL